MSREGASKRSVYPCDALATAVPIAAAHRVSASTSAMRPGRSPAKASCDRLGRLDAPSPLTQQVLQSVKIDVDDRGREQRQKLRENQTTDDRVARLANLRSGSGAEHQWHAAKQCRHCGHQNGTEPRSP